MNNLLTSALVAGVAATSANAAIVKVTADITTPTTWSSSNEYILTDIIFVEGTTLTIEAGTIIRGEPKSSGAFDPGALVVTRTGQINAEGTAGSPIIFTTAALDSDGDGEYSDETFDYSTDIDYQDILIDNPVAGLSFLDSDPVSAPLAPGKGFSTTAGNTAHLTEEYRGLWGGVIILGSAPTSIGDISGDQVVATTKNSTVDQDDVFEGAVEGLDPAVVGDKGVYGGTNPNDSSGTFKYVSIRHGGANLAADNEINGLTMGGVGYGTLIEFVEVYCNADDGYEWFGGTVNTRFLVSLFNNDDSFDIDEGFTGLGQFWYSLGLDDGSNGERGGEHDGTDANFSSIDVASINGVAQGTGDAGAGLPMTYITVYNATYVGGGAGAVDGTSDDTGGGAKENECFRLRDSWGGAYFNSIFTDFEGEFISTEADQDARIASGDVVFRSNIVYNMYAGNTSAVNGSSVETGSHVWPVATDPDTAANNNLFSTNPYSGGVVRRAAVDPRVDAAADAALTREPTTATFFIGAGYAGAFDPSISAYWTDGWSVFSALYDNK